MFLKLLIKKLDFRLWVVLVCLAVCLNSTQTNKQTSGSAREPRRCDRLQLEGIAGWGGRQQKLQKKRMRVGRWKLNE